VLRPKPPVLAAPSSFRRAPSYNLRIECAGALRATANEALPQTDEACFGCGSDRRFMTSSGRTGLDRYAV
jgi:hypothetical protein